MAHILSMEARLRAAFDLSPTVLAITDAEDGRFVDINDAFVHLHGYARAEVIGRKVSDLDLWVDPQQRQQALDSIGAGRPVRNMEARLRARNGRESVCVLNADLVVIDGRSCILTALTDITERVELMESLRRADRAKDEFLAMLGHELRNPLATITNAMALLERAVTDDRARHIVGVVSRQTRHLARLVDDLLDVSRLTSGHITLQRQSLDLHAVAGRVVEALARTEGTARHAVVVEGRTAYVEGDPARIEQIVTNLVDNALKYTPPGGRITVTAEPDGNDVVLRVQDTGKGIDPALLSRVFEQFVQGPQSLERARGGLGLGLAVVKRLVELHGGTVAASSAGPGHGTELTVRLPAIASPEPRIAPRPPDAGATTAPRRRVLIVEDNADAREVLATLLQLSGHVVETAEDGPSGLAKLASFRPDVALVDIGLPGMDGYEIARAARADPATRSTYMVALTGYGQAVDRQRALDAGFDGHVTKPVDPAILEEIVERL